MIGPKITPLGCYVVDELGCVVTSDCAVNDNPCLDGCCQRLEFITTQRPASLVVNSDGTLSMDPHTMGYSRMDGLPGKFREYGIDCANFTRNSDGTWSASFDDMYLDTTSDLLTSLSTTAACPPSHTGGPGVWIDAPSTNAYTTGQWCSEGTSSVYDPATGSSLRVLARISGALTLITDGTASHLQSTQSHATALYPIWDGTLAPVAPSGLYAHWWPANGVLLSGAVVPINSIKQIDGTYAWAFIEYTLQALFIHLCDDSGLSQYLDYAFYSMPQLAGDGGASDISWNTYYGLIDNGGFTRLPGEIEIAYV